MKRLVVLGAGESGTGVAKLASKKGWNVTVSDAGKPNNYVEELTSLENVVFEFGGHSEDLFVGADLVVKSPGIPWSVPIVHQAKLLGLEVIGEMDFCAPYLTQKVIGITGSNGKTTTTLLTGHLLKKAGVDVEVGGNIGVSLGRLICESKAQWFVLELSSFQLEHLTQFSPDIGLVLNISPDHLDRYDYNLQDYANAKFNLYTQTKPNGFWIASEIGFENIKLPLSRKDLKSYTIKKGEVQVGRVVVNNEYTFSNQNLKGKHNAINATFSVAIAEYLGCERQKIQEGLDTFQNAPHRMQYIGIAEGVRYFNDSKATNVDAVEKALSSFESNLIWIVGGVDKGNDYSQIMSLVKEKVKTIIALGVDNSKIKKAFSKLGKPIVESINMEQAISSARDNAQAGDVVLLSPACASFDLFRNYIDRGEQFQKAVRVIPGIEL